MFALAKGLLGRKIVDVYALSLGPGDEVGITVGRTVDAELKQLTEGLWMGTRRADLSIFRTSRFQTKDKALLTFAKSS